MGLTPGFTLQSPCVVRINFGARPFRFAPRQGVAALQAWINDRKARFVDGVDLSARLEQLSTDIAALEHDTV
eukprot:SAG31_NODE_13129_length_891_cov_1.023990_2_plen_71_part_01